MNPATSLSSDVYANSEQLAVHGLLGSVAELRSGRQESSIKRLEYMLEGHAAALRIHEDQALLAQAVHDGQADQAASRTWLLMASQQPACAAFEHSLQQWVDIPQVYDMDALIDVVMDGIPTGAPTRQPRTIPLAAVLVLILGISAVSALALSAGEQINLLGLLLLLANSALMCTLALLGVRWLRVPFRSESASHLIDTLLRSRLQPARAAGFVFLGSLGPALVWLL